MAAKRRTPGAGSVFRDANGVWHFRKDLGKDPATGKRRMIQAKGRTKAEARERFDAKIAELERTGLMPGAKSPYLNDYVERWLEDYRLRVKPTTVLLQCLFDRFGSVFPQCGLMVFPGVVIVSR